MDSSRPRRAYWITTLGVMPLLLPFPFVYLSGTIPPLLDFMLVIVAVAAVILVVLPTDMPAEARGRWLAQGLAMTAVLTVVFGAAEFAVAFVVACSGSEGPCIE